MLRNIKWVEIMLMKNNKNIMRVLQLLRILKLKRKSQQKKNTVDVVQFSEFLLYSFSLFSSGAQIASVIASKKTTFSFFLSLSLFYSTSILLFRCLVYLFLMPFFFLFLSLTADFRHSCRFVR